MILPGQQSRRGPSTLWANQGQWSKVPLCKVPVPQQPRPPETLLSHHPLQKELSFPSFLNLPDGPEDLNLKNSETAPLAV